MSNFIHAPKPCASCPFLRDSPKAVRLRAERIEEIASGVAPRDYGQGARFPCHKTVEHADDDELVPTGRELECTGALIFAYKQGTTSNFVRVMERVGGIDPQLAEGDHPEVFDNVDDMLASAVDHDRKPRSRKRKRRSG